MQWKCQLMFNESTAEDIEVHSVNLCDFLVPLLPAKREKRYPNGTNYMFPERFNGRSSASLLSVELKLAGVKSGLSIVIRSSKSWKNTQRAHTITFKCDHGRSYGDGYAGNWKHSTCKTGSSLNSTKSTKHRSSYKTTSKRPVSAEGLCSFGFIVFLQDESADKLPGRWFLRSIKESKKKALDTRRVGERRRRRCLCDRGSRRTTTKGRVFLRREQTTNDDMDVSAHAQTTNKLGITGGDKKRLLVFGLVRRQTSGLATVR